MGGFLLILKHFRVLGGMSASQISQPFSSSQVQVIVILVFRKWHMVSSYEVDFINNIRDFTVNKILVHIFDSHVS